MPLNLNPDALFSVYFNHVIRTTTSLAAFFELKGLSTQTLGVEIEHDWELYFDDGEEEPSQSITAKRHVRESWAWRILSRLLEYAADGVLTEGLRPEELVLQGERVLKLMGANDSAEWQYIVAMGDGRCALDDGDELTVDKLALLAKVDERTVRNAISSGALLAERVQGETRIMNSSARNWLSTRRGFKATRNAAANASDLHEISGPTQFAAFLVHRRTSLGIEVDQKKFLVFHPSVTPKTISEIEDGVFKLPIDTVFPLADFYQLERREFLACVMRIFFRDEFVALEQAIKSEVGDAS